MSAEQQMDAKRRLIQALLRPTSYPHPVHTVKLCETHISWVLLTGRYAYKIKKPVKLPFLDFSTLELRRHFCEEELRLNRRFAPSLYLDVVPISDRQAPQVGATADIDEYAVRLRQFSSDEELIPLLARGALATRDFAALGRCLGDIHTGAAHCDPASEFGSARRTIADVTESCEEIETLIAAQYKSKLDRVRTYMAERGNALADQMEARRRSGLVRECHGDLHAGNIVRLDGALTPFDCIEFDPALRWIDLMNDTGFLVMDLIARGHTAFAYTFLNAWLEQCGDYDGVRLLRYFAIYRALVRAKVGLLKGPEAEKAKPSAYDYLDLANALSAGRQPRLLLTCGLSGSGKTWLSALLLACLPAIRVRSDVERKRLAGLAQEASSESRTGAGIYTAEFNERTYERLRQLAEIGLRAGEHVIVDAAFLRRSERNSFAALARERGADFVIVHCTAPRKVLERRILGRARARADASEATLDVLRRQYGYWEDFDDAEVNEVVHVDTADNKAIDAVVTRLSTAGA